MRQFACSGLEFPLPLPRAPQQVPAVLIGPGSLSLTGAGRPPWSPAFLQMCLLSPRSTLSSMSSASSETDVQGPVCASVQAARASPQCSHSSYNPSVTPLVPGVCCLCGVCSRHRLLWGAEALQPLRRLVSVDPLWGRASPMTPPAPLPSSAPPLPHSPALLVCLSK